MAQRLEFNFVYTELQLDDLMTAAERGQIDIGVSCISVTEEREERVDFSHAFYETHLAIAVKDGSIWTTVGNFLTDSETLFWLGVLFLTAGLVGGIFYLLEHRINPKLYTRETAPGQLAEGFIMGLLFITRGPFNYFEFKTLAGRVLAVLLAVVTTIFVASFTAILASTFTMERLRSNITGPAELSGLSVGVKSATTADPLLDAMGVGYKSFETVPAMLEALNQGQLDAIVADDPVLRYEIKIGTEAGQFSDLLVLPYQFGRQIYGLVLRENLTINEEIDRAVLAVKDSRIWAARIRSYLGAIR